ncbi:MAG: putative repeat protein (TIGR01451 family), partial [Myxococcota bacterium]
GSSTTITSAPLPFLQKSASRTFYLGGQYHALAGDPLTFTISGGNFRYLNKRCGEPYRSGVLYDDITPLLPYAAAGVSSFDFGDGTFTASATTVQGVAIPANSVYWTLGDVPIHGRFSRSFTMQTAGGEAIDDGDVMANVGYLRHGDARASLDASRTIIFGVPDSPQGSFALGDTIAGRTEIRVNTNDNDEYQAGYGQLVSFESIAANGGASELNDVVMITEIPAGTTLDAASSSTPGTTLLYSSTAGDLATPPGHAGTSAQFDTSWTTTPPANLGDVTFVAFVTDALASAYFPQDGVATSVRGTVRVRIDLPDTDCPETTITAYTSFKIMAYTRIGGTGPIPVPSVNSPAFIDSEPIGVVPTRPDLRDSHVVAMWGARQPGEAVNYSVLIRNRSVSRAPNDTALDLEAVLTMPLVNVNGVVSNLSCTVTDSAGASVDYSQAPVRVTLTWPVLEAGGQRRVEVGCASPIGIVIGSNSTLSAALSATDDICGPVTRNDADTTVMSGPQNVQLTKTTDFSIVSPGSEIVYTLGLSNAGVVPATETWIVDRVPAGTDFVAAKPPAGGVVWFSAAGPPDLPLALSAGDLFTPTRVAQYFTAGDDVGDGWFVPSGGASALWMAFKMDDPSLSPPMIVTGGSGQASIKVRAAGDTVTGDIITNEGAVFTSSLIQAIGERTRTVISTLPSLNTATSCTPVVSVNEPVQVVVTYRNDSTNDDDTVVVTVVLPKGLTYAAPAVHAFDAATALAHPTAAAVNPTVDGQTLRFDITAALNAPLAKGEGGTVTINATVNAEVVSGTQAVTTGAGLAINDAGGVEQETSCITLVENADLGLLKAVDQAAPRSGERVTFTLLVRNEGAHDAADTTITDPLPQGLTYVAGSARVVDGGWSLTELAPLNGAHRWGLQAPGTDGDFPGQAGPIIVLLEAMVDANVAPGTTLENCATVSTTTAEDANADNVGCVTMKTPLPDPWVTKQAPPLVSPGDSFSYVLTYGNRAREDAAGVVLIDALPDGPVPAGDDAPDVTVRSVSTNAGESVWYLDGDLGVAQPPLLLADPTAGGWTQDPSTLSQVTHVAIVVGELPASSGPYSVLVDAVAAGPGGLRPQAGAQFENRVSIGSFSTPPTLDDDSSNNTDTALTRTPGIDLSSAATCSPTGALPGVLPGGSVTVTLALRNTGTVDAYGLQLALTLPPSLTIEADGVGVISTDLTPVDPGDGAPISPMPRVEGGGGSATAFVDPFGDRLSRDVSWVRDGNTLLLGTMGDAADADHYRRVGLPPGATAFVEVTLAVADTLADEDGVVIGVMADTDYRFDWT